MAPKKSVIRIDFSYNGTHFKGYQKQNFVRTIQGEIERVLRILYKEPIEIFAAGRTDSGVHALHQVASFKPPLAIYIAPTKLMQALNALLPMDIRVWDCKLEPSSFHARFCAKRRTYQYIIDTHLDVSPFDYQQKWYYPFPLNVKKLKKTLQFLVGEHHFGSFTEKPSGKVFIRTIFSIKVTTKQGQIIITIIGNSFLRKMIRIIVGTATSIASYDRLEAKEMKNILSYKDRNKNPFNTAPPQGLYFYKVEY